MPWEGGGVTVPPRLVHCGDGLGIDDLMQTRFVVILSHIGVRSGFNVGITCCQES